MQLLFHYFPVIFFRFRQPPLCFYFFLLSSPFTAICFPSFLMNSILPQYRAGCLTEAFEIHSNAM